MTALPIRDNVGAALRFVRENWRFIAGVAATGAGATALVTALGLLVPPLGLLTGLASGLIHATLYAAFIAAVLAGPQAARTSALANGGRVWAAMVIVGLFLLIVFFVISIPISMILAVGPLAPYREALQSAGPDQVAIMAVMVRFAEENPGPMLLVMLFFAAIWFAFTSRLYLAAPASVDQRRIMTFETWNWTKGAMLRIVAARLMLLVPANILAGALGYLVGRVFGVNTLDIAATAAAATSNQAGFIGYVLVSGFIMFALFSALEAALSTYLYRSLKPHAPAPVA